MAIRNIVYTVSADGITPATEQFGGTQEEHNATSLTFILDSTLQSALSTYLPDYELAYRFDIYDGEGNVLTGDSNSLVEDDEVMNSVNIELAEPAARYGGKISVYLIITAFNDDGTKLNLYSFPARLKFKNLPDGGVGDNNARESLTTIAESAKAAAEAAENSATAAAESETNAEDAMQQTIDARFALENGATFVFKGGDSESEMEIELVVDSELSAVSENPVQNKAIKEELDKKQDSADVPNIISSALSDFLLSEDFRNAAFLVNHPVGSIYATVDETDPGEIYGGEWEQVGQGRVLVGVGTGTDKNSVTREFSVGNNDGEYEHTLTISQIPSHYHGVRGKGSPGDSTGLSHIDAPVVYGSLNPSALVAEYNSGITGGGQPHNNTQPSYGVYIWKRIA